MALNISRGVVFKAQKVIIYGPEGIGKSTFAAQFPDPVFIDTEGSTNHMNVARMPKPTSWTMLLSHVKEIKGSPGCCKTLIIDTIDWAEQLCIAHVCAIYDKKGVEDFGYGKGYVFVKEEFGRLLNLLSDVIEIGINVVLTAHTTIRKFELPDECGSYDRYELKLSNKTGAQISSMVKEWADMVLFANYKQFVVEVDKKKKGQGGGRVMKTTHHPCWDAKNRHDLKPELPFEYAQIAYCIPNHTDDEPAAPPATRQEPVKTVENMPGNMPASSSAEPPKEKETVAPPAKPATPSEPPGTPSADQKDKFDPRLLDGLPKALADLMLANQVKPEEIQKVVSLKGYYPQDTPLKNYDQGFIDGVLVGAWEQVFAMIEEERVPF